MSVLIVSKLHLDCLLTFARFHRRMIFCGGQPFHLSAAPSEREQALADNLCSVLGNILLLANIRAWNERYPDDAVALPMTADWEYVFTQSPLIGPVQALKGIAGLRYQIAYLPMEESTEAMQILDDLERGALENMPGWYEAQWAIEDFGGAS